MRDLIVILLKQSIPQTHCYMKLVKRSYDKHLLMQNKESSALKFEYAPFKTQVLLQLDSSKQICARLKLFKHLLSIHSTMIILHMIFANLYGLGYHLVFGQVASIG